MKHSPKSADATNDRAFSWDVKCPTQMALPYTAAAQKVGGGDIKFTPKNASPVNFSHEKHVKGKGIECTGCYYQIFQMAQGSYKMDMTKLSKGDFCGKCHNGQKSFDVKGPENCVRCHK